MVVSTNSLRQLARDCEPPPCLVAACRRTGIKTFQVPHGVNFADFHYDLFPVSSEFVLAGGPGISNFYNDNGVPRERLKEVGIPRYDELLFKCSTDQRVQFRKDEKIDENEFVMLFALAVPAEFNLHQPDEYDEEVSGLGRQPESHRFFPLRDFVGFAGREEMRTIFKFHPLDPHWTNTRKFIERQAHTSLFKNSLQNALYFRQEKEAAVLVSASDLVISFFSNIAIEALAFGKPTILLDCFRFSETKIPFFKTEQGSYWVASSEEEFRKKFFDFRKNGADPKRLKEASDWFKQDWVGPLDGRSGERAAKAICREIS